MQDLFSSFIFDSVVLENDNAQIQYFDLIDRTKNKNYYSNLSKFQSVDLDITKAIKLAFEYANNDFKNQKTVAKLIENNTRTRHNIADNTIEGNLAFQKAEDILNSFTVVNFNKDILNQIARSKYMKHCKFAPINGKYDWLGDIQLKIDTSSQISVNHFSKYFENKFGLGGELVAKVLFYLVRSLLTNFFADKIKMKNGILEKNNNILTFTFLKSGPAKTANLIEQIIIEIVKIISVIYENYAVKLSDKYASVINAKILEKQLDSLGGDFALFTPAADSIKLALKTSIGN